MVEISEGREVILKFPLAVEINLHYKTINLIINWLKWLFSFLQIFFQYVLFLLLSSLMFQTFHLNSHTMLIVSKDFMYT